MRPRLPVCWIALCLAVGCGGGGDPGALPDDGRPPSIVSSSPADGASGVTVGSPIRIVFSKPIRTSYEVSFSANSAGTPVTTHLSGDGKTLTIDPPALTVPAAVAVQLFSVQDYNDRPLAGQPVTLHWSYPDWIPLGLQLTTSGSNLLAVGASGPISAWLENGAMKVRTWSGSSWSTLADPVTANASVPVLAASTSGAPIVGYFDATQTLYTLLTYGPSGWAKTGSNEGQKIPGITSGALGYWGPNLVLVLAYGASVSEWRMPAGNLGLYGPPVTVSSGSPVTGFAYDPTANIILVGCGSEVVTKGVNSYGFATVGTVTGPVGNVGFLGGTPLAVIGGAVQRWNSGTSTWENLGTTSGVVSMDTAGAKPVIAERTVSGANATATVLEWDAGSGAWVALGSAITGAAADSQGLVVVEAADGSVYRSANGLVSRFNR